MRSPISCASLPSSSSSLPRVLALALALSTAGACSTSQPNGTSETGACAARVDSCKCRWTCGTSAPAACAKSCAWVDREVACATDSAGTCAMTNCAVDSDCGAGFVCEVYDPSVSNQRTCTRRAPAGYLVITDLPKDDPYRGAADDLVAFRSADLLEFDKSDLEALRQALAARQPHFVAWVTAPSSVDHNFVQKLVKTFIDIDPDPFLDVSWGLITGSTPEQARALVARTAAAERQRGAPSTTWAEVGPYCAASNPFTQMQEMFSTAGQPLRYAEYDEKLSQEEWAQKKGDEIAKLDHSTFIAALGHGFPTMMLGVESAELAGHDLFPATIFSGACYTAAVNPVWMETYRLNADGTPVSSEEGKAFKSVIKPEKSIALAALNAGAVAFIGNLNTTGFAITAPTLYDAIFRGAPLGDAVGLTENLSLLEYPAPTLVEWEDGGATPPITAWGYNYGGFLVIGDPAYRVYVDPPVADPITRSVTYDRDTVWFEASWKPVGDLGLGVIWFFPEGDFVNNMVLGVHGRVELPRGAGEVRSVTVEGGEATSAQTWWGVEQRDGRRFVEIFVGSSDQRFALSDAPKAKVAIVFQRL